MKHVVEAEWLAERYQDEAVRMIDCRFQLGNAAWGREQYEQEHIPNAVYFDLNRDMSQEVGPHGGRHPLPDMEMFSEKLSEAGIGQDTIVVAYDSEHGAMASRLWWMLTYLGHKRVYVLNGGWQAWKKLQLPTTSSIPAFSKAAFMPFPQHSLLAAMEDVRDRNDDIILIDSREQKRYEGVEEPIDVKAGHIPGAVNYFWKNSVTNDGRFKPPAEQTERFQSIGKEREIIVYCGSGVTACPNVLALYEAGYEHVKLYAGSWSDWITYEANAVAKS